MRSDQSPKQFFDEMNKKPALVAILDSFSEYTVEQLEHISGQPLWIRKVLVDMKEAESLPVIDENARNLSIEEMADKMTTLFPRSPIKYDVFQFMGGDFLMPCGISGSMTVEIHSGYFIYIIECNHDIGKYVVGMDSTIGWLSKNQWFYMLNNSTFCGNMTKPEYSAHASKNLGKNYVNREAIAMAAGPNSYVSPEKSNKAFTIIRHEVT